MTLLNSFNLAEKIREWHREGELDFKKFVDRRGKLDDFIENLGHRVKVWGVGGIGKTALIED